MPWLYPRRVTTVAVSAVALLGTLLARQLLPPSWRPAGPVWVVLASLGAYVVLRLDSRVGWSKRFKHAVMDWFGGDVDDAQTWAVAALAGGGVLVLVSLVQRAGVP